MRKMAGVEELRVPKGYGTRGGGKGKGMVCWVTFVTPWCLPPVCLFPLPCQGFQGVPLGSFPQGSSERQLLATLKHPKLEGKPREDGFPETMDMAMGA